MHGPIVAATDFSARADRAVDRALMLGRELGRDVDLLHALEYAPGQKVDKRALDKKMCEILPPGTGESIRFAYPEGSVPSAIARYAEDYDASLLVLGVARYNSIGDYFLGTAVDRIIRGTSKPVIVVKNRPHHPYSKIVVATDFSDASKKAIRWALETFPDAPIHVVHAFHVPFQAWNQAPYVAAEIEQEAKSRMADLVQELPDAATQRITTHVFQGNLTSVINSVTEEQGGDLVVVGSQGETGFRHATIGSQANAVLEHSIVDTALIGPRVA